MENKTKNRTLIYVIIAMVLGALVGTLAATLAYKQQSVVVDLGNGPNDAKLNAIWSIVDRNYVDRLDADSVMDKVYAAMLSTLDPHSIYLTQKELARETEALRGNFEGVGLLLQMKNDTVCVTQVIPGGPSERAGVQAGDRIIKIDGLDIAGKKMSLDSVVARLRGPRKSMVDITINRLSEHKTATLKVVRNIISMPSLTYSGMLDKKTGYLRLDRFGETTYDEFCNAVKDLKAKGMERLVLDLRDNSGGLLSAALGICDELLPDRELIVYTQGAHQRRQEEHSSRGGLFCKGELIVMIDEYSASASEIVAGAVQDNDRGLIVGRRSFGKGLVQQRFPLPDRSAIQLTTSRYYTPSGRCIQRPYNKGTNEYYADFAQNIIDEYDGDSTLYKINDSTPYYTAKGRTVYGGGGIYPDHTIHYKSDENVVYYNRLLNKGLLSDYIFDYVSYKGSTIKQKHPTEESFLKNYTVSDAMLEQLFANAEKKGIARDAKGIARYREEIRTRIKAGIGDMLYSNNAFYYLLLPYDPELKEALSLMK